PVHHSYDPVGAFRILTRPNTDRSAPGVSRFDAVEQMLFGGIAGSVLQQVVTHLPVGLDDLSDQLRSNDILLQLARSTGSRGDQPFDVELVAVQHEPDH